MTTDGAAPRGLLFVISSPSGAGKTTLSTRLRQRFPALRFSVSYTTRPRRAGETDGADYHFVDDDTFGRMVEADQFAEWAHVHGYRYGTSVAAVEEATLAGHDVLFDIDHQGGRRLKARFGEDAVLVFVLPPSMEELENRLRRRGTDPPEVIERRLRKACEEMEHYAAYQYLVVNREIERSTEEVCAIYRAAHCGLRSHGPAAERLIDEARRRYGAAPAGTAAT